MSSSPHIGLLCATRRGVAALEYVAARYPELPLTVVTFREAEREPRFVDDLRIGARRHEADFYMAHELPDRLDGWDIASRLDLVIAVNWRFMVSKTFYEQLTLGMYVFHDSVLPAYRGFSPTVWAIANSEAETGATLFQVAPEVDSGPIVDQQRVAISGEDYVADVADRVTAAYLDILERQLPALLTGTPPLTTQDEANASYVRRRKAADNRITWDQPSERILALVRAVSAPYAGAYCLLDGAKVRVWRASRGAAGCDVAACLPGQVLRRPDGQVEVVTGDGTIWLQTVQIEGHPEVTPSAILGTVKQLL